MANDNLETYLRIIEGLSDLDGRFSGISRIGAAGGDGHFSLVFTAHDQVTDSTVVLKFCNPEVRDPYRLQCFEREARILNDLASQPDIVNCLAPHSKYVHGATTEDGLPFSIPFAYYALERAETDVKSIIAGDRWGAEAKLLAFRAMCRAVQRIHVRRIVHRDLKPDNFLVMPDRSVKLSDFGTARVLDGIQPPLLGMYLSPPGDLRYVPPEMFACLHDDEPDIAFGADLFALGAVLFELFSGVVLTPMLLDQSDIADLARVGQAVQRGQRRRVFDQFVGNLASGCRLPSVASFGTPVPPAIRDRVDDLYRRLASLDYRKRLHQFDQIFRKINTCVNLLRNEQKYRQLRERRHARRVARIAANAGREQRP